MTAGAGRVDGVRQRLRNELTWQDARSLVIALVIASTFIAPNLAWREGALLCALVLLSSVRGVRLTAPDVAAVAVAALSFASLLWTNSTSLTMNTSVNLTASVIIFVSIRITCRRRRDVLFLASGFIAGAVAAVLVAAYNSTGLRLSYEATAQRVGVDGVNVNFTAYSLVTASAVMVAVLIFRRNRSSYVGLGAAAAFLALVYVGIVLTGARGGLASLVGLLVWLVASRLLPRISWWTAVVVFVVANAAVAFGWSDAVLRGLVSGSTRETGDLNGRLGVWPLARDVFHDHWLLGAGAGSLPSEPDNTMGINAHAVILDVAAGLGLAGVVAFACVWVFSLREPLATQDPRTFGALGALLVVSLPVVLSGFWFESLVLWSAIGLFSRVDLLVPEDRTAYVVDEERGATVDR